MASNRYNLRNGYPLPLTSRQIEFLQMVANGATDKEVACKFGINTQTVKNTLYDIKVRLDAQSRAHAVSIGLRDSLIEFPSKPKSGYSLFQDQPTGVGKN